MRKVHWRRRLYGIVKIVPLFLFCGWTLCGGDPQNTRCKDLRFEAHDLRVIWEFKPDEHFFRYSPFTNLWSTPVAADVDGKTLIYIGCYDHNLYCIDLDSGKEVWRFTSGGKIISSPVFFKTGARCMVSFASRDRRIYCLDARDGKRLWTYDVYPWRFTVQEAVPSSGIFIPDENMLLFGMYVCDKKPLRTVEEAVIMAFEPGGRLLWRKTIKDAAILSTPCYARLRGEDFVFISSANGNLYSISPRNGKVLWRVMLADKTYSSPSVLQSEDALFVYIGDKFGYIYALNEKGKVVWKYKTGHFIDSSPAVLKDKNPRVYVTSFDRKIYCLDAVNGSKIFEFETDNYLYSSPLIGRIKDRRCVLFSSLDNTLFILDADEGGLIQKIKLGRRTLPYETYGETIWPSPILAQSSDKTCLIYPSTSGNLFCLVSNP